MTGGRAATEQNLRKILAATTDGVIIVDEEGVVCYANPAAETMLGRVPGARKRGGGRARGGLVGRQFGFALVAGETNEVDLVRPRMRAAVAEMRVAEIEWNGRPACLASLRDMTERKQAEEERARRLSAEAARAEAQAALRARDEFLSVLAHELKTPLTRLLLVQDRIDRDAGRAAAPDPKALRPAVATLRREVKRLSRMVTQLIDWSRIQDNRLRLYPSPVDVRQVVAREVDAAAELAPRHQVVARLPDHPVMALADSDKLGQVVASLLDNAQRYSPDGTKIEIDLETAPPPSAGGARPEAGGSDGGACAAGGAGETIWLAVRDHGLGVPARLRPHIFTSFNQAHRRDYVSGLGVGLFVCREIVERHGGTIEAEFPEDGGARFVVTLPGRVEPCKPQPEPGATGKSGPARGRPKGRRSH